MLFWTSRRYGRFSFTGYHRDISEERECSGVTCNDGARVSGRDNATAFDICRTAEPTPLRMVMLGSTKKQSLHYVFPGGMKVSRVQLGSKRAVG